MKYIYLIIILLLGSLQLSASKYPAIYAHRGCWLGTEVPENSIAAIEMAKRFGYKVIECDVHYTKDNVMVLMHDTNDMRRCIRKKTDNDKLEKPLKLKDITYAELKRDYVLTSDNPLYRTPVPTFEEAMQACKRNGIIPLLHTDLSEAYRVAQKMFGNKWIAFDANYQAMVEARKISKCPILLSLDGVTSEVAIEKLKSIGGKIGLSSMNFNMMDRDFIKDIRKAGFDIQASIFPENQEIRAIYDGVSIVLSNWCYMPDMKGKSEDTFKQKNTYINKGEHIFKKWNPVRYGATTIDITFKGEIELILNKNRKYILKHNTLDNETIGMRFLEDASSIEIIARDDVFIKGLKAKSYTF